MCGPSPLKCKKRHMRISYFPAAIVALIISYLDVQSVCRIRHLFIRCGWLDDVYFCFHPTIRCWQDVHQMCWFGNAYHGWVLAVLRQRIREAFHRSLKDTVPPGMDCILVQTCGHNSIADDICKMQNALEKMTHEATARVFASLTNGQVLSICRLPVRRPFEVNIYSMREFCSSKHCGVYRHLFKAVRGDIMTKASTNITPIKDFCRITNTGDMDQAQRYLSFCYGDLNDACSHYYTRVQIF